MTLIEPSVSSDGQPDLLDRAMPCERTAARTCSASTPLLAQGLVEEAAVADEQARLAFDDVADAGATATSAP